MISIVIPSYKDPMLHKTIGSLLDNAEGDIEIIPVLDGYDTELTNDERVRPIRLRSNVGMRDAINIGASLARGKYLMRVDEHCRFGQGYDIILTDKILYNWIVTPRRYELDIEKWEVIGEPIDNERMIIGRSVIGKRKGGRKFHAQNWPQGNRGESIYKKTAMQGSCWIMETMLWRDTIGRLETEGYGDLYQDTTEMLFKIWRVGGKLMLNTDTWYAHKARKFNRTHSYPREKAEASFKYALDKWEGFYRERVA